MESIALPQMPHRKSTEAQLRAASKYQKARYQVDQEYRQRKLQTAKTWLEANREKVLARRRELYAQKKAEVRLNPSE